MKSFYLLLILASWSGLCAAAGDPHYPVNGRSFYDDRDRGWFSYETPVVDPDQEKEPVVLDNSSAPPAKSVVTPKEILKQQGEDWENALAMATLDPTRDNLANYLQKTSQIMKQGQTFSGALKRFLWTNPQFDYTLKSPVTPQSIQADSDLKIKATDKGLNDIAESNGILFFFRSDCPYCHRFAPILKKFAGTYGFNIIPVSLDGGGLPDYPNPKQNIALGKRLGVKTVPAYYLVNPVSNTVVTAGFGFTSFSELQARILYASSKMKPAPAQQNDNPDVLKNLLALQRILNK